MFGVCVHKSSCYLVFELCDCSLQVRILFAFVSSRSTFDPFLGFRQDLLDDKEDPLDFDDSMEIAQQTATALVFLHAKKIAHRDIKPGNILLLHWGSTISGKHIDVKLIDFGLSKSTDTDAFTGFVGTPSFMAPELIKRRRTEELHGTSYDATKVDVWAFGILLHYMYTGVAPFRGMRGAEIIAKLLEGTTPEIGDDFPDGLKTLLADCWNLVPQERPTMAAIEKKLTSSIESWKGRHTSGST
jgi:serine/threonine protein kinase